MKIAAIDIGSNAARLLIVEANADTKGVPFFRKINLVRVPLRLGFDVFDTGIISKEKEAMLLQTMMAFKQLLLVYNIQHFRACATSSLRDATNGKKIIPKVKAQTGIDVEIISGMEEAGIIFHSSLSGILKNDAAFLFIDVGGGSTEVTFFERGVVKYSRSFNIGTIRILKNQVTETQWNEFKEDLRKNIKTSLPLYAIGSGGNINKIFSMSKIKEKKPLKLNALVNWHKKLKCLTLDERIEKYELREDRADVIVPALEIFMNTMQWAKTNKIIVPKIGLADGLVSEIYESVPKKNGRH